MSTKETGIKGEKIAENYLKKNGYQILERNYSSKFISGPQRGEIDIIAKKNNTISFVEVKTLCQKIPRSRDFLTEVSPFDLPERKVDLQKQKKIIKTAEFWLMEKKISLESRWQIDVIALIIDSDIIKLRHLKNAVFW